MTSGALPPGCPRHPALYRYHQILTHHTGRWWTLTTIPSHPAHLWRATRTARATSTQPPRLRRCTLTLN